MNLYIYGSGGNGCELCDIAERINHQKECWENIFFVDDIRKERDWYGRKVYRFNEMLSEDNCYECVISLGEPLHRLSLYEKLVTNNVSIATLIDPSAEISPSASIDQGCIVGSRSFISSNSRIKENTMLEVNTIIGHDISIGKHSVISSCTVIGGATDIGDETFIGLNCTVKDKLKIGDRCVIGMGSSVFKDIQDGYIALGNPARPIKKNEKRQVFK